MDYCAANGAVVAEGQVFAARQHALAADRMIATAGSDDEKASQREAIAEALTAIALHLTEPAVPSQMDLARAWAEGVAWATGSQDPVRAATWYVDDEGAAHNPYLTGRPAIKVGGTDDE